MWEDEVLDSLHKIRESHAKSFDYDFEAIFADWQKKQTTSKRELVSLQNDHQLNKALKQTTQN